MFLLFPTWGRGKGWWKLVQALPSAFQSKQWGEILSSASLQPEPALAGEERRL